MRAITYDKLGPASDVLSLQTLPDTPPGPGEVCVKLTYSGANPSDVKSRAGRPGITKPAFDLVTPHSDGAGVIAAVGDGVAPSRLGQRVWIWNGQWQRPFGTAATHITLPADQAVPTPAHVDDQTAANMGIPGLTACHAVFGGGDVKGQTLLIHGGAGTVSFLAIKLAKWGGAKVITTCGSYGADRVKAAGADVVLDYRADDLVAQVLAANDGALVDQILEVEFGVNIAADTEMIAPNGRIAAYGSAKELAPTLPILPLLFKAVTIDIILVNLLQKPERDAAITRLHAALKEGALNSPVQVIFPLAETAKAHEAVEAGARSGAVLIDCQA